MAAPTATDPMATRLLMQMADSMATQSWQGTMMYTTRVSFAEGSKDMVAGQPVERIEKLSGIDQVMRRAVGSWVYTQVMIATTRACTASGQVL